MPAAAAGSTVYPVLFAISLAHLLNDMIQSVVPAIYPMLKENYALTFGQIGLITLVYQMTSSIFQPFVGLYADRHPRPYSLAFGMCLTLSGLLTLAVSWNYGLILIAVGIIGCGSSISILSHPVSRKWLREVGKVLHSRYSRSAGTAEVQSARCWLPLL